ncbi:hypothetical protein J7K43_07940 [Candidatus Calescamantes bacterium]|nr:hypothetical protein [Candidatus Calescamantes bacterium]
MLGNRPQNIIPPNPKNAKKLKMVNSPNISTQFCSQPDGEYLVEEVNKYKILVKKPDTLEIKANLTGCTNPKDFTIWVFEPNGNYWMPKHFETLKAFYNLNPNQRDNLFNAINEIVLNFREPIQSWQNNNCKEINLAGYPSLLVLSYLKWMAVLEDTRYPPNIYLGRKMAFAGYVLVHSGLYKPDEIKRLLKIW